MVHSYSPNGLIEDPDNWKCCCGVFHVKTGGRILAILQFLFYVGSISLHFWLNGIRGIGVCISAFILVFYSVLVVIGVFGEKRFLLLPFLILQGIIALGSIIITAGYGIIGAASDSLVYVHKNVTMIRELYEIHHMNPDDEKIQTLFSCGLLIIMFLFSCLQAYIWLVFYGVYKYFSLKDTIIGPERGYQRGKIVADTLNQDY